MLFLLPSRKNEPIIQRTLSHIFNQKERRRIPFKHDRRHLLFVPRGTLCVFETSRFIRMFQFWLWFHFISVRTLLRLNFCTFSRAQNIDLTPWKQTESSKNILENIAWSSLTLPDHTAITQNHIKTLHITSHHVEFPHSFLLTLNHLPYLTTQNPFQNTAENLIFSSPGFSHSLLVAMILSILQSSISACLISSAPFASLYGRRRLGESFSVIR